MNTAIRWRVGFLSVSFLAFVLGAIPPAYGLVLQDQNSSVTIDPTTQNGMYDWIIDGVNLSPVIGAYGGDDDFRQWFWYRVGNTAEASIDTLNLNFVGTTDTDFDTQDDTAFLRYLGAGLKIELTLSLVGATPGSGTSDIGEQISLTNTGAAPLTVSFYQYVDFELDAPNIGNETVWWMNANTTREVGASGQVTETVNTPVATYVEAAAFPVTINKLNDGFADNLSGTTAALGDVTWANQWDFTLAAGQTVLISKDKQAIIPEPSTVLLVVGGLLGLFFGARRRR